MKPLTLAFLWHLHQPPYRLRGERVCFLPWVRLHTIRSYYDMARILEEFPDLRMTFNVTCTLIEQIRAYEQGGSDLFLETGGVPAEDLDETQRIFLFDHFFAADEEHMIGDLPRYADLLERRNRARRLRGPGEAWKEFATSDYRDLQAFFDLCWFGFKAREDFPELRALRERGLSYTQKNVTDIHAIEQEILRRVLALYREAAARGQIEIATSPYAHPILPLLCDTEAAREAMPHASLPPRFRAPDDARVQVEDALALVERELGIRPRGLWPSEGALSREAAEVVARCGVAWAASDEQVLAASEAEEQTDPRRVWALRSAPDLALVFRHHDLSDRIGFTYARVAPARAAEDFLAAVADRSRGAVGDETLVLVALDGENPWERYPRAGARFLRALFDEAQRSPALSCQTVGAAIEAAASRGTLRGLRAGSWIHADLGTWIGGPEKNRAWTVLGEIRAGLEGALRDPGQPADRRRAAWESLRAAEGSDWFWWLDGQFGSHYRAQLDQVFRGHLRQACEALERLVPDFLGWPIPSPEHRAEAGYLAEPAAFIEPCIDGFEGDFFEWHGAVQLIWTSLSAGGSMQKGVRAVRSLRYGFSRGGRLFVRLDPDTGAGPAAFALLGADLSFRVGERAVHLCVDLDEHGDLKTAHLCEGAMQEGVPCARPLPTAAEVRARKIFELAVPCGEVGLPPRHTAGLLLRLRLPSGSTLLREIGLRVPDFGAGPKERAA